MLFICKRLQIKMPPGVGKEKYVMKKRIISLLVVVLVVTAMVVPALADTCTFSTIIYFSYTGNKDCKYVLIQTPLGTNMSASCDGVPASGNGGTIFTSPFYINAMRDVRGSVGSQGYFYTYK